MFETLFRPTFRGGVHKNFGNIGGEMKRNTEECDIRKDKKKEEIFKIVKVVNYIGWRWK